MTMRQYTPEEMISGILALRDKAKALAEKQALEAKPIQDTIKYLETQLHAFLLSNGGKNFKTDAGTAYLSEVESFKVADWGAFYPWVLEQSNAEEFFIRNANKTAIQSYLEAPESGGTLPPGLQRSSVINLNVRRSAA